MEEVRMPFKRVLEANVFQLNAAHHRYNFDKISVVLPWENADSDTTELNYHFSDDAIVIHKDLTLDYPQIVSQGTSESLIFGSCLPHLDSNKATGSDLVLSHSSASMTEHSGTISPKGNGRCGCGNCRETNTRCRFKSKDKNSPCQRCLTHGLQCGDKLTKKQYRKLMARAQGDAARSSSSRSDSSSAYSDFFEIFSVTDTSVQESLTKSVAKHSLDDLAGLPSWDSLKVPFCAISARYDITWDEPLGRGQYADVFKAIDKNTQEVGNYPALSDSKVFAFKVANNAVDTQTELIAIKTVSKKDSPNPHIIHVFDCWFHHNAEEHVTRTFVKMQLCDQTLKEYLDGIKKSGRSIEPLEIVEIMIQILSGLCLCHEKSICHRDLTLSNIMSVKEACECHQTHSSGMRWLITDFGFAMRIDDNTVVLSHRKRGTCTYRAPELIQKCEASKKSDIWALGCILYRVATMDNASAFRDDCQWEATGCGNFRLEGTTPRLNETQSKALLRPMGSANSTPFWQHLNSVLGDCFAFDPKDRPTAHDLKKRFEHMRSALLHSETVGRQPYELERNVAIDNQEPNGTQCISVH